MIPRKLYESTPSTSPPRMYREQQHNHDNELDFLSRGFGAMSPFTEEPTPPSHNRALSPTRTPPKMSQSRTFDPRSPSEMYPRTPLTGDAAHAAFTSSFKTPPPVAVEPMGCGTKKDSITEVNDEAKYVKSSLTMDQLRFLSNQNGLRERERASENLHRVATCDSPDTFPLAGAAEPFTWSGILSRIPIPDVTTFARWGMEESPDRTGQGFTYLSDLQSPLNETGQQEHNASICDRFVDRHIEPPNSSRDDFLARQLDENLNIRRYSSGGAVGVCDGMGVYERGRERGTIPSTFAVSFQPSPRARQRASETIMISSPVPETPPNRTYPQPMKISPKTPTPVHPQTHTTHSTCTNQTGFGQLSGGFRVPHPKVEPKSTTPAPPPKLPSQSYTHTQRRRTPQRPTVRFAPTPDKAYKKPSGSFTTPVNNGHVLRFNGCSRKENKPPPIKTPGLVANENVPVGNTPAKNTVFDGTRHQLVLTPGERPQSPRRRVLGQSNGDNIQRVSSINNTKYAAAVIDSCGPGRHGDVVVSNVRDVEALCKTVRKRPMAGDFLSFDNNSDDDIPEATPTAGSKTFSRTSIETFSW
eukprot:CFRG1494T1